MKSKQIAKTIPLKALVMDDDQLVRMVALLMLEECGYEAHLTKNGNEAVDQYRDAKDSRRPFDIVILDLNNLHGMGGEEAMRSLLDIDPDVRAVVSSGDVYHPAITDHRKYGFCGALLKPFSIKDLRRVLSDAKKIGENKTEYMQ